MGVFRRSGVPGILILFDTPPCLQSLSETQGLPGSLLVLFSPQGLWAYGGPILRGDVTAAPLGW